MSEIGDSAGKCGTLYVADRQKTVPTTSFQTVHMWF